MTHRRVLYGCLLLGLVLRLSYGLAQDPLAPYQHGRGDSWWYLEYGRKLVFSQEPGPPPAGPVYLLWVGLAQDLIGPTTRLYPTACLPLTERCLLGTVSSEGAIIALRLLQAFLGTATCYAVYRLSLLVMRDRRAALLAAAALALSPAFIMESTQILTETLYLFLLLAGMTLAMRAATRFDPGVVRLMATSGLLLGLATLTRAILLLFPLTLALYLLWLMGWRRSFRLALTLVLAYALVVSTWTLYNRLRWNQWVIGAQGLSAFLYIGAAGWQGPQQVDQGLAENAGLNGELPDDPSQQQQVYQSAALELIRQDLPGWLGRRAGALASALLQPHGTTFFPGESLKDVALDWLRRDRTLDGLVRLVRGEGFWPKLVIYLFHYVGLIGGLAGIWLTRRRWRMTLPLIGLIVYVLAVHFVLDAIPRYLFPLQPVLWIFAAFALARGRSDGPNAVRSSAVE